MTVAVVAAAVAGLPQEVPGLANIEILKLVPKRSPLSAYEAPIPFIPTAADRRYDVMLDYDDYSGDYDADEGVATTLKRPLSLLAEERSDYTLRPFDLTFHRQSDASDGFIEETQGVPPQTFPGHARPQPPLGGLGNHQGNREMNVVHRDSERFVTEDRLVPDVEERLIPTADERFDSNTEERFAQVSEERFVPDTEERFISETVERFIPDSEERFIPGTEERFILSTKEKFTPDTRDIFVPNTEEGFVSSTEERFHSLPSDQFPHHTDERLVKDNSESFPQATDEVQTVLHHASLTPDKLLLALERDSPPLVTEGSRQQDTIVVVPPSALWREQQGIDIGGPITSSVNIGRQVRRLPDQHDSRSGKFYLSNVQHSKESSLLSSSLQDIYKSQALRDSRFSRASYSRALHHSESGSKPQHRSQLSPQNQYRTSGKKNLESLTTDMSKVPHQTTQQDHSSSRLAPSYVRRAEPQLNVKKDRSLKAGSPPASMSREERAYYTGLQQEIEKSELLVDAIKDVRMREGKSIKTLRRRHDSKPSVITSPQPDLKEVKEKFGSHPLYQNLPRNEPLAVKEAGPLQHRDEYSSERDEYEKMYLPVRAKTLELREIRKVKEHFHSLIPLKMKEKPRSTSRPRRQPQSPPVTTFKPALVSKYIKYSKPQSVTTSKTYYKSSPTSYVKLGHKKALPTPRNSKTPSGYPKQHTPTPSDTRILPKSQSVPSITKPRNNPAPSPKRSDAPPSHRTPKTQRLLHPNTPKPISPSSHTHRSHRSSRMYLPQEQPSSAFESHRAHHPRTSRSFGHDFEHPTFPKTLDHADKSLIPQYTLDTRVLKHSDNERDSTVIQSPPEVKVRRKRGPEIEELLDSKAKFPRFGYDIDPYFSDFPRFGFFDSTS
ncbi:hypothetical protein E2C01_054354 [Portunus trituberculatus]|uniref:Uncharacterized protein n=1 Tax=Portunus trituberculatus TaxID=210409 RepID=A0A5B7GRT0_PORTR|nr:hypothetical protein [Portunus trituberculatus]